MMVTVRDQARGQSRVTVRCSIRSMGTVVLRLELGFGC